MSDWTRSEPMTATRTQEPPVLLVLGERASKNVENAARVADQALKLCELLLGELPEAARPGAGGEPNMKGRIPELLNSQEALTHQLARAGLALERLLQASGA